MEFKKIFGTVSPPPELGPISRGPSGLNLFINNAIGLFYTIAVLAFMVMLFIGAFNWITAGADKDKLKGAQVTIRNAIIGLVFLAFVFIIVYVLSVLLGFQIITPGTEKYPIFAPGKEF